MDYDRLAKLLASAGSDNDSEALAALRAARRLLAKHHADWRDLFKTPTSTDGYFEMLDDLDPIATRRRAEIILGDHEASLLADDRRFLRRLVDHDVISMPEQRRVTMIEHAVLYAEQLRLEQQEGERPFVMRR